MIRILIILLISSVSFAAEIQDPKIKSDFALVEEQMETSLYGLCSWDEKVFTTDKPNEFYTEILCSDGTFRYKFGTWLMYNNDQTMLRAEAYAVSGDNNVKWFCTMEGQIEKGVVHSEMACKEL